MPVELRAVGDVQVVEVSGAVAVGQGSLARPLDLKGQRLTDLGAVLADLMGKGQCRIVLDLRQVNFIDSSGIGELVFWKQKAVKAGGDIKLLQPTGRVREVLELTRILSFFQLYPDPELAVAAFGPPR